MWFNLIKITVLLKKLNSGTWFLNNQDGFGNMNQTNLNFIIETVFKSLELVVYQNVTNKR